MDLAQPKTSANRERKKSLSTNKLLRSRGLMITCRPIDSREVIDYTDLGAPFNLSEVSGLRGLCILTFLSGASTQKKILSTDGFRSSLKVDKESLSLWLRSR